MSFKFLRLFINYFWNGACVDVIVSFVVEVVVGVGSVHFDFECIIVAGFVIVVVINMVVLLFLLLFSLSIFFS